MQTNIIYIHACIQTCIVALSYTFFMVFGGLLLNLDDIPVAFKWLEYLSIFRYAFHALTKNELQGLELTCTPAEKQAGQCVEHGDQALDALGLNDWGLAVDFIAMGIMTVVYMLFAYVALRRLKRT